MTHECKFVTFPDSPLVFPVTSGPTGGSAPPAARNPKIVQKPETRRPRRPDLQAMAIIMATRAAIRTAHMSRSHWMCTHASQSAEFQLVPLRVPLLHLVPRAGKTCNVFVEEGYRDECAINQRKLKAAAAALARTCLFVI